MTNKILIEKRNKQGSYNSTKRRKICKKSINALETAEKRKKSAVNNKKARITNIFSHSLKKADCKKGKSTNNIGRG